MVVLSRDPGPGGCRDQHLVRDNGRQYQHPQTFAMYIPSLFNTLVLVTTLHNYAYYRHHSRSYNNRSMKSSNQKC